ncbi:heterokaryon incompatibility protein-domain-containing protein [Bisporella sp. PMI_857]|nr:heterokaryon incompatibility protein-domain-containing protein [Bisporella sp. PMI_857]
MTEAYQYVPIPDEKTFRVLKLLPGKPSDELIGELIFVTLDTKSNYEAISYVWGDATRCEQIICNGKLLALTQSLSNALRRLRDDSHPRWLWADQICINQDDPVERSKQVQLMNAIYKNTTKVLAWLGRDDEEYAAPAFDMIECLNVAFQDDDQLQQFTADQEERLNEFPASEWRPLGVLYRHPWLTRVWIGQEAGTGVPMELFWGEASIDWETLLFVSKKFERYHTPLRFRFDMPAQQISFLNRRFVESNVTRSNPRNSFIYQLHRYRGRQSTDPRDRIFSLLGHYSARMKSGDLIMVADYSKTTTEISFEVAIRTLQDYPTLETLNAVQHGTGNRIKLPSWAPDWANGSSQHLIGHRGTFFNASRNSMRDLTILNDRQGLILEGVRIDIVEDVSNVITRSAVDFDDVRLLRKDLGIIWRKICGFNEFSLRHRYANGESAVLAFCQTLSAGCAFHALRTMRPQMQYHDLPTDTWLRHGAAFLVRTYGHTILVDDSIREASAGGDAFAWLSGMSVVSSNRSFFQTKKGYWGLGSHVAEGDIVCVLFGGTTPFCLRPSGDHYILVGECYFYGFMNGEAVKMMEMGELIKESFHII